MHVRPTLISPLGSSVFWGPEKLGNLEDYKCNLHASFTCCILNITHSKCNGYLVTSCSYICKSSHIYKELSRRPTVMYNTGYLLKGGERRVAEIPQIAYIGLEIEIGIWRAVQNLLEFLRIAFTLSRWPKGGARLKPLEPPSPRIATCVARG